MAAKLSSSPSALSLYFPDGTEVDDDDSVEVSWRGWALLFARFPVAGPYFPRLDDPDV